MWPIAMKDFWIYLRDRGTIVNLFVLPLMFAVVLTAALGGVFGGGTPAATMKVPLVLEQPNPAVTQAVQRLPGVVLTREGAGSARSAVASGSALAAIVVRGQHVMIWQSPTEPATASLFRGAVASAISAGVSRADLATLIARIGRTSAGRTLAAGLSPMPAVTHLAVGVTRQAPHPSAVEQYVPGFTVAFLFFIAATIVQSFFSERERGTMARIRVASTSPRAILAGKLIPTFAMGIIQAVVMFAAGHWLFGLALPNPAALLAVTVAISVAANGLGLLVTSYARTQSQAQNVATLLVFLLAAVGGCYVPRFYMPPIMRSLALATPQGWAMRAYQAILLQGQGLGHVWPNLAVLMGFGLVFFVVALLRFRVDQVAA